MQLFKYFFRQFSCVIYVEVIFQVSIKSDERLRRKMMNKFSEKRNFIFYMYIKSQNSSIFVNGLIAQLEERSSLEPMVSPMVVGSNPGRDTISKMEFLFY